MESQLFYSQSPLVVLITVSLILFLSASIGSAIGRRSRDRIEDKSQVSTIQASLLGILGLLLGFTFAVASSRYDSRRLLAIDEANALGTAFMGAQMLPEPHRTKLSDDLQRYIRLRASPLAVQTGPRLSRVKKQTEQAQHVIRRHAIALARERDTEITSIFIDSLNQSLELYSSRVATYYARVPNTILWILLCIAIVGLGMVGYGFGMVGQQGWLVMGLVSVTVAAVMVMIVDLDRPEAGPTRTIVQTMTDLKNSLPNYQQSPGR